MSKKFKVAFSDKETSIYINNKPIAHNINNDIDIKKAREDFGILIQKIISINKGIAPWISRTIENNTLISSFFEDYCYIVLIEKIRSLHDDVFIKTNKVSILINFSQKGDICSSCVIYFFKLINFSKIIIKNVFFLIKHCLISTMYKRKKIDLSGKFIVQTWVNYSEFLNSTAFTDRYFGNYFDEIHSKDKAYYWVVPHGAGNPYLFNKKIKKHTNYFTIYDFINICDIFQVIRVTKQIRELKIPNQAFSAMKEKTIKFYIGKEHFEEAFLFYLVIKKWNKLNFKNIKLSYLFENMITEKSMLYGIKKFKMQIETAGFFHSSLPNNLLCLHPNILSSHLSYLPDKLFVNLESYESYYFANLKDIIINKWNNYVITNQDTFMHQRAENSSILIILPGVREDIDYMIKLIRPLLSNSFYYFVIRKHPMINHPPVKTFKNYTNMTTSKSTLINDIKNSSKVVSFYSSAALKCAQNGVKVGLVYKSKSLLLNPFDNTSIKNYTLIQSHIELNDFLASD